MRGAIVGDIVGAVCEVMSVKTTSYELFLAKAHVTDDRVLTMATALPA